MENKRKLLLILYEIHRGTLADVGGLKPIADGIFGTGTPSTTDNRMYYENTTVMYYEDNTIMYYE